MKRLTFLLIALLAGFFLLGNVQVAEARDGLDVYSVSCTTYPVTEAATVSADISGYSRIMKIIISHNDVTDAQTVTFYEQADSSTTATSSWSVDIDSVTADGGSAKPIIIDFYNLGTYWYADDVAVRKSSSGSNIKVTYWYW